MKRGKNIQGLTLIELVVTMAIMVIAAGIVIPKFDMGDYLLKTQAQQLCGEIRNIRALKMSEGEYYQIALNRDFYQVKNGIKELKKVEMLKNYRIFYEKQDISFTYSGVPNSGNTITIMNEKNGRRMKITIVPSSGRVLLKNEIFTE